MSERCDRCGSVGEDRRTLWMGCFYRMTELGLPFGEEVLFAGDPADMTLSREGFRIDVGGESVTLEAGRVTCSGELTPLKHYTLRVCKRCRAEWMRAVKAWFHATPEGEDHDADVRPGSAVGSGIFVRDEGSLREITREEWDRRMGARHDGHA